MNQQKTGEFLRHLRKDKGMTQEQLAEQFYVSTRTVSRWESGSNMPDLAVLIELADFYDVDIREIIDGERKSDNMDKETKDTLKKVAAYAEEEKKKMKTRITNLACYGVIVMLLCSLLLAACQYRILLWITVSMPEKTAVFTRCPGQSSLRKPVGFVILAGPYGYEFVRIEPDILG